MSAPAKKPTAFNFETTSKFSDVSTAKTPKKGSSQAGVGAAGSSLTSLAESAFGLAEDSPTNLYSPSMSLATALKDLTPPPTPKEKDDKKTS